MFQSSYTGLKPLHRNIAYAGGFCRFWYIPVEQVAVYPRINAATQFLVDEPLLKPGGTWFGPIEVPRNKFGFSEDFKKTKAGHLYSYKVEGMHLGDSAESRVNLENMAYHRYLVVAKQRAGGSYLLMGTLSSPMRFEGDYKGGLSPSETAGTQFIFALDHRNKAYVLPQFNADAVMAPGTGGGGAGTDTCMNKKETIYFVNQPSIPIVWTPERQSKFGSFPLIQVWLQEDGGIPIKTNGGSIEADAPPPAFTQLTVRLGGNPTGFIEIM